VADCAGRNQDWQCFRDVLTLWHCANALLSLERCSGTGSEGSAWGEKRCRGGNREGPPHLAAETNAGPEVSGDRNPKKRRGGVSCDEVHSQAREMVTRGYTATLLAATLAILHTTRAGWTPHSGPLRFE
jgi:hypothetical protein